MAIKDVGSTSLQMLTVMLKLEMTDIYEAS